MFDVPSCLTAADVAQLVVLWIVGVAVVGMRSRGKGGAKSWVERKEKLLVEEMELNGNEWKNCFHLNEK
jgi:hypothetical protein